MLNACTLKFADELQSLRTSCDHVRLQRLDLWPVLTTVCSQYNNRYARLPRARGLHLSSWVRHFCMIFLCIPDLSRLQGDNLEVKANAASVEQRSCHASYCA